MTYSIIILFCAILLFAYLFEVTSSKTRIPTVILLLMLGFLLKEASLFFNIQTPDLNQWLRVFGNLGLILIVLEGSLELELKREKITFIIKSLLIAVLPILALAFSLAWALNYFHNEPFRLALLNALPIAVISSAIAIPSSRSFSKEKREFVTYESSFSDIAGVLLFDFILKNNQLTGQSIGVFSIELVLTFLITLAATLMLAFLLDKIRHHVKFVPIILIAILIYTVSKSFHLPALLFILFFGVFLGNLRIFSKYGKLKFFGTEKLKNEVEKFREITAEGTFLVRSLFFILFGFHLETEEILNQDSLIWALGTVVSIYILRSAFLFIFKFPIRPFLFMAPRGLITVLLFMNIAPEMHIEVLNRSYITQVIILTAVIMMFGLISYREKKPVTIPKD